MQRPTRIPHKNGHSQEDCGTSGGVPFLEKIADRGGAAGRVVRGHDGILPAAQLRALGDARLGDQPAAALGGRGWGGGATDGR